ncbi:MAG: DUF5995 family protein [Dehalococcoidia bacterium]
MKTALLLLLALFCIGLFACNGDDAAPSNLPAWESVAEDLRPALDPASANPCQSGDRSCLDIVANEMRRRLKPLAESCNHNALFATMYLRMTEEIIKAYDGGRLQDPAATAHFTAWFASYYFRAFDDWTSGKTDNVPQAWQIAFQAADDERVRGLGNLLLGMNAHVSRDLPYVVADVLPETEDTIDPDYQLVNDLIESLSARLLSEVADRFDPTVATAQLPLVLGGAPSFGAFVALWRSESWVNGNQLIGAGSNRASIESQIETNAGARALAILPEVSYLPFVESASTRDAYCAKHT